MQPITSEIECKIEESTGLERFLSQLMEAEGIVGKGFSSCENNDLKLHE